MGTESTNLVISIETSRSACAGAAAAYLMRRISAAAGAYAPGIQERMFRDIERNGRNLNVVDTWFASYQTSLAQLGYQLIARRVAFRSAGICNWVAEGNGLRGAVMPTNGLRLHPDLEINGEHAVALTADIPNGDGNPRKGLTLVDPWPGTESGSPPENLDEARRELKFAALLLFWSGYS